MFADANSAGFPEWANRFVRNVADDPADRKRARAGVKPSVALKRHQRVVSQFLADSPYRGLLVYHGLGSGKTCAAIAAAEALGRRTVFVMLPASLRDNFEAELDKCARTDALARNNVHFVSTNGISAKQVTRKAIRGVPLADACIIIDEVHNLVSQAVNGRRRGSALVDAVAHAPGAKVIALSGTPIINTPFEIGALLNLVLGPEPVLEVGRVPAAANRAEIARELKNHPYVARSEIEGDALRVWTTPLPFSRAPGGGLHRARQADRVSPQTITREIAQISGGIPLKPRERWPFPRDAAAFDEAFLNADRTRLLRADAFKRRAVGAVSYHRLASDQALAQGFPTVLELPALELEMSPTQFDAYISQRTTEIQLETKQKLARKRSDGPATGVFRAFSRAVSNFGFDNESKIRRVFPRAFRAMLKELGEEPDAAARSGTYEDALARTLADLAAAPRELRGAQLREHSPKFDAVLRALQAAPREKALVYSQFRRVEGLGILALVLLANGFAQLSVSAAGVPESTDPSRPQFIVFDSAEAQNRALVALFNGDLAATSPALAQFARKHKLDIRALFISQSGAEGINLKGVRHVHILEPYWNEIRIQQVVGRAARLQSHAHLPPAQRTVTVHRYLAVVPRKHDNFTIRNVDKNQSTDQIILAGARGKMTLVQDFLEALQAAAVDCTLTAQRPGKCYLPPLGTDPHTDMRDVAPAATLQIIQRGNKTVLLDPRTKREFDHREWLRTGKLEAVAPR